MAFDAAAIHPLLLGVFDRVLGHYQLSAPTGIQIGPGEQAQVLHRDDSVYPLPPDFPNVVVNTMWTLDDFCREHELAPDVVKLDVEGFQAKIVPGALGVIREHRPVVLMEFDAPGASNDFGITNREVIRPLMDDGYRLVWGRHRSTTDRFRVLAWDELGDEHETNSLGILVP